jgi:hypothetical protein
MKMRIEAAFFGVVAMAGLLAATPAKADRVSVGLGFSNGYGNYFSLGVNSGGRGCGPSHHGYGHGHSRGGYGYGPRFSTAVVIAPRPVVYAAPQVVYAAPPPPVVVQSGYWQEREERYWVEGCWVDSFDAFGRRCKTWQTGRWEVRRIREWVQ